MKTIGFASDHAGFELKKYLIDNVAVKGLSIIDYGTYSQESCDYPDFAHKLASSVENNICDFGIAICGSGNGINMTVNKHQKIRGALCWNEEIAVLARKHNNANICSLPARFIAENEALNIVNKFLNTNFDGGRHITRINKIPL